jgi:hypothetical protein
MPFVLPCAASFALALLLPPGPAGTTDGAGGARTEPSTFMTDSLVFDLVVPGAVPAGTPFAFLLRLTSRSDRPLDLYLRGRTPTFDVEVSREDGTVAWHRLQGEIIPAIVHLRTLAPGERVEARVTWDQRDSDGAEVGPGAYVARGSLLGEDGPLTTPPARFRILRP